MKDFIKNLNTPLSKYVQAFMSCPSCGSVVRDGRCPFCETLISEIEYYFLPNVLGLIGMMERQKDLMSTDDNKSNYKFSIVIFFCTLGEVLLEHFLVKLMMFKMKLPYKVQKRLLDDNLYVKQRTEKLFPDLTGVKWATAVKQISESSKVDYIKVIDFYKKVSEERNNFLHEGDRYKISEDMSENCICHIEHLVGFFVDLHNKYVVNSISKKEERDK